MKNLANLNLILTVVFLWLWWMDRYFSNLATVLILSLVLWYNWETLKRLKGQRNKLTKLNYVIGILNILVGALLVCGGILRFVKGDSTDEILTSSTLILGSLDLIFGLLVLIFAIQTLKIYRDAE